MDGHLRQPFESAGYIQLPCMHASAALRIRFVWKVLWNIILENPIPIRQLVNIQLGYKPTLSLLF